VLLLLGLWTASLLAVEDQVLQDMLAAAVLVECCKYLTRIYLLVLKRLLLALVVRDTRSLQLTGQRRGEAGSLLVLVTTSVPVVVRVVAETLRFTAAINFLMTVSLAVQVAVPVLG